MGEARLRMVRRAEKESAESSVCAAALRGAVEVVGSKSFLSGPFCELCFCQMASILPSYHLTLSFLHLPNPLPNIQQLLVKKKS